MLYTILPLVVWYVVCEYTFYVDCILYYTWGFVMWCVKTYTMLYVNYVTSGSLVCHVCEYNIICTMLLTVGSLVCHVCEYNIICTMLLTVGGLVCRVCEYIQPQSGNPTLDSWVQDLYPQSDPSCDNPDDTNIRTAECRLCKYLVINVTFILHGEVLHFIV